MTLSKLTCFISMAAALFIALFASSAVAATSGYGLVVVPQTVFVQNGQTNVAVNYTATNNTFTSATCDIIVEETGFVIPLGTIAAGTNAGGQFSTPISTKNGRLTFDLVCGGIIVAKDSSNVKNHM